MWYQDESYFFATICCEQAIYSWFSPHPKRDNSSKPAFFSRWTHFTLEQEQESHAVQNILLRVGAMPDRHKS